MRKASTQAFILKLRQTRIPSLIVVGFLFFGVLYFKITYPQSTAIKVLLYTVSLIICELTITRL